MVSLNKQVNVPALQKIMMEFAKENERQEVTAQHCSASYSAFFSFALSFSFSFSSVLHFVVALLDDFTLTAYSNIVPV
jgi:hypothetical protein